MRHLCRSLSVLLTAPLFFFALVYAQQPWSNILSPNRAINWQNAGLPPNFKDKGGSNVETAINPWTPPTRTQSGSTISPSGSASTDSSNINTALSNCTDGHYVLLGPGTFQIQGTIQMQIHSCTLRGSGPQSTILNFVNGGSGVIWMGAASNTGTCTLTSGSNFAAGSTSITCTGSKPPVGGVTLMTQCDTGFTGSPCAGTSADNGGLFVCGGFTTCMTEPSGGTQYQSQYQVLRVTSVSGSGTYTVGISPALYMPNWSFAHTALLTWNDSTYDGIGVGIEDLTIQHGWVQMQNTYASWIKGVRVISPAGNELPVSNTLNSLLMNDYFFIDTNLDGNYDSGIKMSNTSATLILNNITTGAVEPWEGFGGNAGNVFAYNLGRDSFTIFNMNSIYDHHAYSSFDLFEGNQVGEMYEDDTWGTHGLNTYFRNYASCGDVPYTMSTGSFGIAIDGYQRFENAIGNAIGTLGGCSTYQNTGGGSIFRISTTDPIAGSSLMRWGNVSVARQSGDTPSNSGVRFMSSEVPTSLPGLIASFSVSVPSNNNLPCSFFMSSATDCTIKTSGGTGLSWWKVCKTWTTFPTTCAMTQTQPFPAEGPDESSGPYVNGYAYDIPAAVAWQNLPVDTTYQNTYKITGSSWSGGMETLTITGLPNTTHLIGAFQLSGVSSACTSGATFGNNSEILMTGSTSATVKYALSSNPGASCTGTMKFPDVRQFDERVYESDLASSPTQPPAPSGVTGTVTPLP
jgi:hypothetical protein